LVPADDIVVEHGLDLPAFFLCHFGKVLAAVQTLLLSGYRQKDDGRRELALAKHARTFQTHSGAAGVVIGAGRRIVGV